MFGHTLELPKKVSRFVAKQLVLMEISVTEQELKTRRAPQTFNVRLDLLQQLSERAPKGQWSRWLEQILIRELQENSYRGQDMS